MTRSTAFNLIALCLFALGVASFFLYDGQQSAPTPPAESGLSAAGALASTSPATSSIVLATSSPKSAPQTPQSEKSPDTASIATTSAPADEVARIQNPYSTAPESFDQVNADARAALVNILCQPEGSSSLDPISGSGVIIDPRGIILTNAHVAQYVLLSESPQVDLSCQIRTGSPARAQWSAEVLYIPPIWVDQHASEILEEHPTGTGEHDYALLYITGSINGAPLPAQFPYLPFDTRPAIGFPGDQVLVASYPAEFIGGIAAQYDLYAASSVTTIKQLLTFETGTPDALSLGGIIEAQSGSSGGAVVNAWDRLVGIIATTSDGTTTAERDLRAISMSYIDTDLMAQSGDNLTTLLQGDPAQESANFNASVAPALIQLYVSELSGQNSD